MSTRPEIEPAAAVRACAVGAGVVRIYSHTHVYAAQGQTHVAAGAEHPTALDYLLGALASDLVAGLLREARRVGARLDAVEASLTAELENPLVALGVVGERGRARVAGIAGSVYVSGDLSESALHELWLAALGKAPVYATLRESVAVDVAIRSVP